MTQRDYYQVLGIARDAASRDIRAAFVRLARHHHPDQAQGARDLPLRLHEVQRAYRCLSDADARAAHDRALAEAERFHAAQQRQVQRRLRRYDGRHPHAQPRVRPDPGTRPGRRLRWKTLLMVTVGAAIVARASFGLG